MIETSAPGVYVTEIDASEIVPSTANSTAVFCGNFIKGQTDVYRQITSVEDLIKFYGKPTNSNYNDWYQAYNFLQYGNNLLVSRAVNINGSAIRTESKFLNKNIMSGFGLSSFGNSRYGVTSENYNEYILIDQDSNFKAGDIIGFSTNIVDAIDETKTQRYYIVEIWNYL